MTTLIPRAVLTRTLTALVSATALLAGCSDDAESPAATATAGATATSASTAAAGGGGGGGGGGAGGQGGLGGSPAGLEVIAAFDPAAGELPEGVAVLGGAAYVGFAATSQIVTVGLDGDHPVASFGSVPVPPPNAGFMTGLAFDAGGTLHVALVSFDPMTAPGIYRIGAGGGAGALWASDPGMVFPNGLAFDAGGDLLVTDSAAGAVFRVTPAGAVSTWSVGPLLAGQMDFCGPGLGTFDIGANGIAIGADGAVYVANNDKASIVRIPVGAGGAAGTPELVAGPDCDALGGADGLVIDADGTLLVANNRLDRLTRVTPGGAVEALEEGGLLDFPASLAIADVDGDRSLLVTSFALAKAMAGQPAHPALLALPLPAP